MKKQTYKDFTSDFYQIGFEPNEFWSKVSTVPMLSFNRPSKYFWNAMMNKLIKLGWTEQEAKNLLTSTFIGHHFNDEIKAKVEELGKQLAKDCHKYQAEVRSWTGRHMDNQEAKP